MRFYADLHIHSHYSRATSKEMNVIDLSIHSKQKGLNLLGTGDFTHPKWLNELKEKLKPNNEGLYEHNGTYYVLQGEISNIYTHKGKGRRVHHIILAPDFKTVDAINNELLKHGRTDYDGRPIFKIPSKELVKMIKGISEQCEVIPAHAWTPWFGVLGEMGGYESLEECYEEETRNIHAIETGLSSDPLMNWRCSFLDKKTLLSNSDSHSPWSWRIGRECNVLDIKPAYDDLIKAIRTKQGLTQTIEVDPSYGKYHWTGHRLCNVSMNPKEAEKINNVCPVCRKKMTVGVESRVNQLADNELGRKPENATPYINLIPLAEIISIITGKGVSTKKVQETYNEWIKKLGNEYELMLNAPEDELLKMNEEIGNAVIKVRKQEIKVIPGYDGEYGKPLLKNEEEKIIKKSIKQQYGLDAFI